MCAFCTTNRIMIVVASIVCVLFLGSSAQQVLGYGQTAPILPTPPPENPGASFTARPAVGIAGATSATGASVISEADIRHFVMAHNIPGNMGGSTFSIILVLKLPSQDVVARLKGLDPGLPKGTLLWYVEMQGRFVFPGSSQDPNGISYPVAFEAFFASNGNLLMEGGLSAPTAGNPTPVPSPTAAASPTLTPTAAVAPTATPRPTATRTPTCSPFKSGTANLNVDTGYADFDTGATSISAQAGSDIFYNTSGGQTIAPIKGAAIVDLGKVNYASVSCTTIRTAKYGSGSIVVADGDVFLIRTNGGHYAKALVHRDPTGAPNISIQWQSYTVS